MNNFQLNNTSVYLGGQCKWDIVLSHNDDELEVVGFQLSPISNNVPFNKRGDITKLNDNHSYTLKKFCKELKESFWSTDPCLDKYTQNGHYDITGYYDDSFTSGLKRAQSYQVYNKQFEYLQPLWLEMIEENQYLKFNFNIYSINQDGDRNLLDTKTLSLKTRSDGSFHDSFVNYFNNWLKYLSIKGPFEGFKGNDRAMFIDLRNGVVQLDGVSTTSGQLSGKVSCDYISNNLLSNERPNIETDYILSTMFKNHNVVASQLLNLNFCLDIADLFDPFLLIQMKGLYFSVDCVVELVSQPMKISRFSSISIPGNSIKITSSNTQTTTPLDRRSIFSNYEYIKKDIYNPFLFTRDIKYKNPREGNSNPDYVTGRFYIDYTVNYTEGDVNDESPREVNRNVLDYLQDYSIENISSKNKITQPIVHWGYQDYLKDTFNLYEGYRPYIASEDIKRYPDETQTEEQDEPLDETVSYLIRVYKAKHVNGVSIPLSNVEYSEQNGALSWFYPNHIMYFDSGNTNPNCSNLSQEIDDFMTFYWTDDVNIVRDNCLWRLSESPLKESASNLITDDKGPSKYGKNADTNYTITLAYVKTDSPDSTLAEITESFMSGFGEVFGGTAHPRGDTWRLYCKSNSNDFSKKDFLIVSTDFKNLTLCGIKKINQDIQINFEDDLDSTWKNFIKFIRLITDSADSYNNLYDFYGFDQELKIGRDNLDNPCYYKSLGRNTFVYRKCGKLFPYLIEDPDFDLNYFYYRSVNDGSIKRLTMGYPTWDEEEDEQGLRYSFEDSELGKGKMLVLSNELNYTIIKKTSDSETLEIIIKEKLLETYGYDNDDLNKNDIDDISRLINYIYNLYNVNYKYDYKNIDSLDEIKYEVKMILK